jgi:cytochrome P450
MSFLQLLPLGGVLVFSYIAYGFYNQIIRKPEHLKHLPSVDFWTFVKYLYRGEAYDDVFNRHFKDKFAASPCVASPALYGWQLQIADPELARFFTSHYDSFHHLSFEAMGLLKGLGASFNSASVVLVDGDDWKRHRGIVNQAFSKLKPTPAVGRAAMTMLEDLDREIGQPCDVDKHSRRMMFRSLIIAVFDIPYLLENDRDKDICKMMDDILHASNNPFFLVFHQLDRPWFPGRGKYFTIADEYDSIVRSVIDQKRRELSQQEDVDDEEYERRHKGESRDLLTLLLKAMDDPDNSRLTDEELLGNVKSLFLAGHETTATALTMITHMLAQHPEIQDKVRVEVFRVLGAKPGDSIVPSDDKQKELVYLNAVIKEAERMYPPTAQLIDRRLPKDMTLPDGTFLPKGSFATVNIWRINRDPKIWKDPDTFNPERHMGDNREGRNLCEFMTFSAGKRICPGITLANIELRVMVAMMVQKYTWTHAHTEDKDRVLLASHWLMRSTNNEFIFQHLA